MLQFDGSDQMSMLVDRFPQLAEVFLDLGLEYVADQCLAEAIGNADLNPRLALAHIAGQVELPRRWHEDDWSSFPLDELVDHISATHHFYSRECVAQLRVLIAVIADSAQDDRLLESYQRFQAFAGQLCEHLDDEEKDLFDQCRLLEQSPRKWLRRHHSLHDLTSLLTSHHDLLELQLARLMALVQQTPWPAPHTDYYHVFLRGLENLEHDLVAHTYLEYEYLMPGAIHLAKLERSRAESHITTRIPSEHVAKDR